MKAYLVFVDEMDCVVFAETAAKARWRARKSAHEAGYQAKFKSLRSVRKPDWDYLYHPRFNGGCYTLEHVMGKV